MALNIATTRLYHNDIVCLDPDWHGPLTEGKGEPNDCVILIRFLARILKRNQFKMAADHPGQRQTDMETPDRYSYGTCAIMYQGWRTAMPHPVSHPLPARPSMPVRTGQSSDDATSIPPTESGTPARPAAQHAATPDVDIVRRTVYPDFKWDDLGRTARDISNECFLKRGGKVGYTKYKALDADRRELVEVNIMLGRSKEGDTNEVLDASDLTVTGNPFPQLREHTQRPSPQQCLDFLKCKGYSCWRAIRQEYFPIFNKWLWNDVTITTVNYCAAAFSIAAFIFSLDPPQPPCSCPPAPGPS